MAMSRGLRRLLPFSSSQSAVGNYIAGTREAVCGASTSGRGWDSERSFHTGQLSDAFNGLRQHLGIQPREMHQPADRRPISGPSRWGLGSAEQLRWKWEERGGGRNTFLSVGNKEAVEYQTIGTLPAEPFTVPRKKVFAAVELCGTQHKVSPNDLVYTQQLFDCDINDKLSLGRVLMLGSCHETIIGRPLVPGAYVTAVVEEHFLNGKVLIFKKRRRKNSRRLKGHRQPMTCIRILDIHGIDEEPSHVEDEPGAATG